MKTILLALLFLSNGAFAQNFATKLDLFEQDFNNSVFADDEYPVKFELVSSKLICPTTGPRGTRCMAYGSIVTIKAKLKGCVDSLAYFKTNTYMYDNKLHVEVDSMGLYNPQSASVRCIKMPEVIKEVYVQFENFDQVIIENLNTLHK